MAIRFDASGDSLSRARLAGAKTVMAWVYVTTDRNDYTVFFGLGSNELIGTGSDGTTLLHYDGVTERTGSALSTGTWYHLAYTSNGDDIGNGFTVYLNGVSSITSSGRAQASAGTNMYLGNDQYSEWLNGRLAHVKVWSAALSVTEIQQEMYSIRPQRLANLHSWLPMIATGSDRTNEAGGNGNAWTANGTLTDEAGPPISWGLAPWIVPFVATGPAEQTIAPAGIASGETFGATVVSAEAAGQSVLPGGVASGETFGAGVVAVDQVVAAVGVAWGEYALRFYGNAANQIDRVRIPLEDGASTQYPPNVGAGDFTVEFWLRAAYADNATAVTDVRYSNIVYDRDSWGEQRGHCIGVTRNGSDLVAIFGQAGSGGSWAGIRSTAQIGDGNWHHVAVTRTVATGVVRIWVDGVQEASGTYDTSNWSYPAGHTVAEGQDNEALIIGTEKHDVGYGVNGAVASLRISNNVRYTASFTPAWRWAADANAVGLYQLDDGAGTVAADAATVSGAPTNGELLVGGAPVGPIWNALPFGNFGDATVAAGGATVVASSIGSGETFGDAVVLPGAVVVLAGSVVSGESFGDATAAPGGVVVAAAGIESGFASDNHLLSAGAVTVLAAGVASGEAFGDGVVLPGGVTVLAEGLASGETFGAGVVLPGGVTVLAEGLASGETFGDAVVLPGGVTVLAEGLASGETVGEAGLLTAGVIAPSGVASGETFGDAVVLPGAVVVLAGSVVSGETFGDATVAAGGAALLPTGIVTAEAFGDGAVLPGTVTVLAESVASGETFGELVLQPGAVVVVAEGVATAEAWGATVLALGGTVLAAAGIASGETFGDGVVLPGGVTVLAEGLASGETFGLATVAGDGLPQFVVVSGIVSGEAFGLAVLLLQLIAGRTMSIGQERRVVAVQFEQRTVVIRGG